MSEIEITKARLEHAESNYKYWTGEYANHGDKIAEKEWHYARITIAVLAERLDKLNRVDCLTISHTGGNAG